MKRCSSGLALAVAALALAAASAHARPARMATLPDTILWAWEHPQDLRFLDPRRVGVAYFALALRLEEGRIDRSPRRQILRLAPGTKTIAVARIETGERPDLGAAALEAVANDVAALATRSVVAIQLDFDARRSERDFYRRLAERVRALLPESVGLSMTALASWCMNDPWLRGMPVDETVPMLFRMGAPDAAIRHELARVRELPCETCRASVGLSTDEPIVRLEGARRVYWFHPGPWTSAALRSAGSR
jgi:hypothetical protein